MVLDRFTQDVTPISVHIIRILAYVSHSYNVSSLTKQTLYAILHVTGHFKNAMSQQSYNLCLSRLESKRYFTVAHKLSRPKQVHININTRLSQHC